LREFGQLIVRNIRGEDVVCRYGGDEFIVVMPDTSVEVTSERAEQILTLAKEFKMRFEGRLLSVISISIGISFFPENGATKSQILNTADIALFRAKNEGRGRVIISEQYI